MQRTAYSRIDVVVVLVLGLISLGLVLVFLPRQRERGLRVQCMYNLKTIGEGVQSFHKEHDALPPARIDVGYATWPVLLAPHVTREHPLHKWDLRQSFLKQDNKMRGAVLPLFLCPARQRTTAVGADGALGDYAAVSGDGDPWRPWTGPEANGPMILGVVTERRDELVLGWRGRVSFASLKRGLGYTLLAGEKHVPAGAFGDRAAGDGSIYDGRHPTSFSRVAGPGYALATGPDEPMRDNFGSAHAGLCEFLVADGSVRTFTVSANPEILGRLATRE